MSEITIANCSGYYGDRMAAAREMVEGGPIDYLTGDWLAELTMLILSRRAGYAKSFVRQMEQVMATCVERGIKVVSNAGGLDPRGCAAAVKEIADRLGLSPTIAYVDGDDLMPRFDELRASGERFVNIDTGEPFGDRAALTANAYLGCWGIVDALSRGADIVITGRTTDAAVVAGPAAFEHGWARDDWDAMAGAIVAGHVIECGTQATGGNYSFFEEVPNLEWPGFPIAEIDADGSSVITKHPDQGGMVSIGTVTAQLLYEIGPPAYLNPDVTSRFDSIRLDLDGPDRVRISGVRGEPPPPTAKVIMNYGGGYATTISMGITGLDIEAKAGLYTRALFANLPGGREAFDDVEVDLIRTDHENPMSNDAAIATLRITFYDTDADKVGRGLNQKATELGLANYPGLMGMPGGGTKELGVVWPTTIPSELLSHHIVIDGEASMVDPVLPPPDPEPAEVAAPILPPAPGGPTVPTPLGRLAGARSGDKGGNANLGLWVHTDEQYAWLADYLTVERFQELLPDTARFSVSRYELPNIHSLNFVVVGILGLGVAASVRNDPQAKGFGEYLRAKIVHIPIGLLDSSGGGPR
jgi:hypothetical protein